MLVTKAVVTIKGMAPYSQSRKHEAARLDGEDADAYDKRTWREKQTVTEMKDGTATIAIPAFGMHCAIIDAAKYSGGKIKGEGAKRWTEKFRSGVTLAEDPPLNIAPDKSAYLDAWVHVDGRRGSAHRVWKRFPMLYDWMSTFELWILDPVITQAKLRETIEAAGLFVGVGRYRPQVGGTNGRFVVTELKWLERQEITA